jgi:hypothetical protein
MSHTQTKGQWKQPSFPYLIGFRYGSLISARSGQGANDDFNGDQFLINLNPVNPATPDKLVLALAVKSIKLPQVIYHDFN